MRFSVSTVSSDDDGDGVHGGWQAETDSARAVERRKSDLVELADSLEQASLDESCGDETLHSPFAVRLTEPEVNTRIRTVYNVLRNAHDVYVALSGRIVDATSLSRTVSRLLNEELGGEASSANTLPMAEPDKVALAGLCDGEMDRLVEAADAAGSILNESLAFLAGQAQASAPAPYVEAVTGLASQADQLADARARSVMVRDDELTTTAQENAELKARIRKLETQKLMICTRVEQLEAETGELQDSLMEAELDLRRYERDAKLAKGPRPEFLDQDEANLVVVVGDEQEKHDRAQRMQEEMTERFVRKLTEVNAVHDAEMRRVEKEYAAKAKRLQRTADEEGKLRASAVERLDALSEEVVSLRKKVRDNARMADARVAELKAQHHQTVATLRQTHADELDNVRREASSQTASLKHEMRTRERDLLQDNNRQRQKANVAAALTASTTVLKDVSAPAPKSELFSVDDFDRMLDAAAGIQRKTPVKARSHVQNRPVDVSRVRAKVHTGRKKDGQQQNQNVM